MPASVTLITGALFVIGIPAAITVAKSGSRRLFSSRNQERGHALAEEIRTSRSDVSAFLQSGKTPD